MSDSSLAPSRTAYAACLVVLAGLGVALFFTFIEPFAGTTTGFAGRILGPIALMLVTLSLIVPPRRRGVALVLGLVLGVCGMLLVFAGRVGGIG